MRLSVFVSLICLVFAAFCGGCSDTSSAERKALAPFSTAVISAATGLGDLRLGKTTIGAFVREFGPGRVAYLAGDETAIELSYLDNQFSVLFILSESCKKETDGSGGARTAIGRDLKAFLAKFSACGEITLSSVSVAAGPSENETFFKGATEHGIRLWSTRPESIEYRTYDSRPGNLVAGDAFTDDLERVQPQKGIYLYYPAGAGPTSEEIQSGRPLSPERLREIQESANNAAKNPVLKRITIFVPTG